MSDAGKFGGGGGSAASSASFSSKGGHGQRGAVRIIYPTPNGQSDTTTILDRELPVVSGGWDGTANYLLLAGGGGGGGVIDGGGGAGGYRTSWGTGGDGTSGNSGGLSSLETALILSEGTDYFITVGQGGEGALGYPNTTQHRGHKGRTTSISGSDITTVTTTGGGGGHGYATATHSDRNGGSGGGGSYAVYTGGTGTTGEGFAGGTGVSSNEAGGGGGAGAVGGNASANVSGDGGAGLASTITGISVTRAGGGGGGSRNARTPGDGGAGGGGGGGDDTLVPVAYSDGIGGNEAEHGRAQYGAGGGGAGYSGSSNAQIGGNGGSGIAIFRLPSTVPYSASQLASDVSSLSNCTASYLNTQVYTDDTNFGDVVLLLDGEGTSIEDKSLISSQHTVTAYGPTTSSTQAKFGSKSLAMTNTAGNRIVVSNDNGEFSFGTDSFTIEAWVYLTAMPASNGYSGAAWVVGGGPVNSNTGMDIAIGSTNIIMSIDSFLNQEISVAHGMSTNQWYHVAWVRNGTALAVYVDGVQKGTATSSATADPNLTGIAIGAAEPSGSTDGNFPGFIDDIRVTKGVARYSNNFTPPTSDLTNTVPSGTVELRMDGTNGSGSGSTTTDLSDEAHNTITSTGVTAGTTDSGVTRPDLYGGAKGYLDFTSGNSGRIVTLPTTVDLSSGDFTIECWVLFDTISQFRSFMRGGTGSASGAWQLQTYDSKISLLTGGASTHTITDSKTVTTNTWYHVALSYVSSTYTMTLSVDGNCTSLSNQTEFSNMQSSYLGGSGTNIDLGANRGGTVRHDGLLTDVRFTTGTALYPDLGRITPIPTAALPSGETSTGGDHVITFTVATEDAYDGGATTNDGTATWNIS